MITLPELGSRLNNNQHCKLGESSWKLNLLYRMSPRPFGDFWSCSGQAGRWPGVSSLSEKAWEVPFVLSSSPGPIGCICPSSWCSVELLFPVPFTEYLLHQLCSLLGSLQSIHQTDGLEKTCFFLSFFLKDFIYFMYMVQLCAIRGHQIPQ